MLYREDREPITDQGGKGGWKKEGYSPEKVNGRNDPGDNKADDQQREDYAPPIVATLPVR